MKAEIEKLKEDFKQEMKTFRESIERELRSEVRDLKNEKKEMASSIEFAHGSVSELQKKLEAEVAKNVELSAQNETLRGKCAALETRVEQLETRTTSAEQYSRNTNVEIQGVTQQDGESVHDIVAQIGLAVNEPVSTSDIESCHRVPNRRGDKANIVVQFRSRAKRDTFLKKAKKMRLTNNDAGHESEVPIYVNEHLCPALKKLLGMAIKKKYECKWKSVWSFNGKIFAKQVEDGPVVAIKTERDLDKIC